jgi:hypothetical protein
MAITPPPYDEINGIYIQIDKHVDSGLFTGTAPQDGNARPGQMMVDTSDYNVYVGNDTGNVRLVGPSLTQTTVDDDTMVLGFNNQNQQILLLTGGFVKVPTNSQVALPIGFAVTLVTGDNNTGYLGITNDSVTVYISGQDVNPLGSEGNADQAILPKYSIYGLIKTGTNTWILSGPGITESYC